MSDPDDAGYERIVRVEALRPGQGHTALLAGRAVAIFRVGGECHAISGRCPHNGQSLHDGSVSESVVTCRWHGWRFDMKTGATPGAAPGDGSPRIRVYPVRVVDGWVEVSPRPANAGPAGDQPG